MKKMNQYLLAGGLAMAVASCASASRQVVEDGRASNTGTAAIVMASGINLDQPVPREELRKAVEGECDVALTADFYNNRTGKTETILSCEDNRGNKTENVWSLNVDSICNVLYRDEAFFGFIDVDWAKKDELYFVTREGNRFSLYFDEQNARDLSMLIRAYMPQNVKSCVDMARFETANYSPLRPLGGQERVDAQQRYAAWFASSRNALSFAAEGKVPKENE